MRNLVPSPLPIPDFTPVPRKCRRYDGWTAERQRAFIEALADTGSVKAAAHRINMSFEGAYYLRRQPGAESFAAAWNAALDHGVQQLADIALERAMQGVPVPVFYKGEQCGEKRWYNDRLLMFLLKHRLTGYDSTPLPRGTRHPDTIAREAAENCPVCKQRAEEEEADPDGEPGDAEERWLDDVLERYLAKVSAERRYRRAGQIVAADFTLRQLTYIELILDAGGRGEELIHAWTREPGPHGEIEIFASPLSARLDALRREAWERTGDPPRPPLTLTRTSPGVELYGGPTHAEREKARNRAEKRMAAAQAEWEAAQREDSWAEWKAQDGRRSES